MKSLEILSQELITIGNHLAESEGEIDFHLESELEHIQHDLMEKVDHYTYRIEKLTLSAEFWKSKAQEAKDVEMRIKGHIARLKENIKINMDLMGKKELSGSMSRFYLKKNPKPSVIIEDANLLPSTFKKQMITITDDKAKILEAITNGESVPGAKIELGEHLAMGRPKVGI